jgi:glycosyltransferase involved in cell wall biosynthesis
VSQGLPSQGLVFIGSHLGYPMDRTPLGGGAMAGLHLARHWARQRGLRLAALGSGPEAPFSDSETARYARLAPVAEGLVDLPELAYARFCRRFEKAATAWLLARRAQWRPEETVVVVNDISEGPDLAALKDAGYRIVSIWHVDVVDYFNKLYLKGLVRPARLTALHDRLRGLKAALPDVLKLIFEKQRATVELSDLMVLPSRAMADTIESCYAGAVGVAADIRKRCLVQPWGAIGDWSPADPRRVETLRRHYQIGAETDVILTLSRISPEKGIHLLIEALGLLEREGKIKRDTVLIVCGEAAFMMGKAYLERVRRAAARLRLRVFFPGYLSAADKPAYFALAQLFVSPSVHESYGLNVVEAMRAGLPVLASDHYGVRDILRDEYGVRVPYPSAAEAPKALADALERLLNDRERLKRMGEAAAVAAKTMTFETAASDIRIAALGLLPKAAMV